MKSHGASELRKAATGHGGLPKPMHDGTLIKLMAEQNPKGLPTGPGTGRCPRCGAGGEDVWDSKTQEGCDICGWLHNKVKGVP